MTINAEPMYHVIADGAEPIGLAYKHTGEMVIHSGHASIEAAEKAGRHLQYVDTRGGPIVEPDEDPAD